MSWREPSFSIFQVDCELKLHHLLKRLSDLGVRGWSLDSFQAHWIINQSALAIAAADYHHSQVIGGNGGWEFSDFYLIQEGLAKNITAITIGIGGEEGIDALMVRLWPQIIPVMFRKFVFCRFSMTEWYGRIHMAG